MSYEIVQLTSNSQLWDVIGVGGFSNYPGTVREASYNKLLVIST